MSLDHERARFLSSRLLDQRFADASLPRDWIARSNDLKGYRSVVLSAPSLLMQGGFLQLVSFWLTKKTEDPARAVLEDLLAWLRTSQTTMALCLREPMIPGRADSALVSPLLQRKADELALLESEALQALGWMKRFTEALAKDRKLDVAETAVAGDS